MVVSIPLIFIVNALSPSPSLPPSLPPSLSLSLSLSLSHSSQDSVFVEREKAKHQEAEGRWQEESSRLRQDADVSATPTYMRSRTQLSQRLGRTACLYTLHSVLPSQCLRLKAEEFGEKSQKLHDQNRRLLAEVCLGCPSPLSLSHSLISIPTDFHFVRLRTIGSSVCVLKKQWLH